MDELRIKVEKTGGIWHGLIEGHPEVDERGLTKEIAERKVREVAARLGRESGHLGEQSNPHGDR